MAKRTIKTKTIDQFFIKRNKTADANNNDEQDSSLCSGNLNTGVLETRNDPGEVDGACSSSDAAAPDNNTVAASPPEAGAPVSPQQASPVSPVTPEPHEANLVNERDPCHGPDKAMQFFSLGASLLRYVR